MQAHACDYMTFSYLCCIRNMHGDSLTDSYQVSHQLQDILFCDSLQWSVINREALAIALLKQNNSGL